LCQIIIGSNDSLERVPGRWLQAAIAAQPESLAIEAYALAARRSGLTPLQGSALAERSQHVIGLYRREELVAASRRTLETIRATIPSDTTRVRFDRIFRPRGQWIVDLHDAALAWGRSRMPGIRWQSARRALEGARWIPPNDSTLALEAVPRALYGLSVLAASDSAAYGAARADLWRADSASALAALTLLHGYSEGMRWYGEALGFFLTENWIPDAGGRSIADYVRDEWHPIRTLAAESAVALPAIQTRWFGYPQAVPRYGVPPALFRKLVRTENASAVEWLERHGQSGLLQTLRLLPSNDTTLMLQVGSQTLRLTTVPRQSRVSLNGFLEPRDAIEIDPGFSPLLALGAVVHEWQHLLFRRHQLQAFAARFTSRTSRSLELPGVQPYVAEGFAEWSTERILAPLAARWPLLAVGESEKRAGLAHEDVNDQHATGYALIRALAAALANPAATTNLLLKYADHPSAIVKEPLLRRAWDKYRGTPDRRLATPGHRLLVPEVTFTIEDGFPEVVESRIRVLHGSDAKR
jgi:hypothetical protein